MGNITQLLIQFYQLILSRGYLIPAIKWMIYTSPYIGRWAWTTAKKECLLYRIICSQRLSVYIFKPLPLTHRGQVWHKRVNKLSHHGSENGQEQLYILKLIIIWIIRKFLYENTTIIIKRVNFKVSPVICGTLCISLNPSPPSAAYTHHWI